MSDVEQSKARVRRVTSRNSLVENGNGNDANDEYNDTETQPLPAEPVPISRRLSTYTSQDGSMDLEDEAAGSARR